MSDIFNEIKEDLRSENFARLAKRYGKYVVILFFAVLLYVAVLTAQKDINMKKKERTSTVYLNALDLLAAQKTPQADALLSQIIASNVYGYKEISALVLARDYLKNGQDDKAITAYMSIANDRRADKALRNLAMLDATYLQMESGKADDKQIDQQLDSLSGSSMPWRPFALELRAYRYIQAGNNAEARKIFDTLKSDLSTPANIRKRAEQLSSMQSYEK